MSTTQQESADYRANVQKGLGDNYHVLTDDMDNVRNSGVIGHALKVGQKAPTFTLPDAFGEQVSSQTLLSHGPVVITFYRGHWCPFCNIALHGLQQALPEIQKLGASLVAISPEKPDYGIVTTQKNELTYPVLSDFGNQVARQFGIVFRVGDKLNEFSKAVFKNDLAERNGDDSYELPVPATYILDAGGVIRFAHVEIDYMTGRVDAETVLAALEAVAKQPHAEKVAAN